VATVVVALILSGGCGASSPAAGPAKHACGSSTAAATARTIDIYVAVLRYQMAQPESRGRQVRVLYVVEHAVASPRSTSTASFTAPVRQCLASVRFSGLPPIRLVTGVDDPRVPKAGQGPIPIVADGRVVQLESVPLEGDVLEVAASSSGGGGFDAFGGIYVVSNSGGSWRVVSTRQSWIA